MPKVQRITKRQREALRAVYDLASRKGSSPTIREIRIALDVSSDQAVIELLERLEKNDYILRDKNKARSITLTEKARKELDVMTTSFGGLTQVMPELGAQQQRVYLQLVEIDPKLARMYKGALSAMHNDSNEDNIAQSAHSFRQVIDHLAHKGKVPDGEDNSQLNIKRLNSVYDPRARQLDNTGPYKHFYSTYITRLHGIAHHEEYPTEEEYKKLITEAEQFLLVYIFPSQIDAYRHLEEILERGPSEADPVALRLLVKKNIESEKFFLKHASVKWLTYLREHKFLSSTWETGDYLARVAMTDPETVTAVLLETSIPEGDLNTMAAFAMAASKLPATFAARIAKKIIDENWARDAYATLLNHRLQELLVTMLDGGEFKEALALADTLLDISKNEPHASLQSGTRISDYQYEQIVKIIRGLKPEDALPFLEMLVEKLKDLIAETHINGKYENADHSHIWRRAIEEHSQNRRYGNIDDIIIDGVRDLLEKRIKYLVDLNRFEDARDELEKVLKNSPDYSILLRFRLHIYRLFPSVFTPEIEREISFPRFSSEAWHEHSLLVRSHFGLVSKKCKLEYFKAVDAHDNSEDAYADSWRARHIGLVSVYLSNKEKEKYAELLKVSSGSEQPHFTSYSMELSWAGPESPQKEDDLENMSVLKVLDLVKTWKPDGKNVFGPSRAGLGLVLRGVVAKKSEEYSSYAPDFFSNEIKPVYLHGVFSGLVEASRTSVKLDWAAILRSGEALIIAACKNTLPFIGVDGTDRAEPDWDNVMQELLRLISRGLETNSIPFTEREAVWQIIKYLVEHPDPTSVYEEKYGGDNMDPYTMSVNTIRGEAFHCLFAYMFWCNRAEESENKSWEAFVPSEVKEVLELHLDPAHDSSIAIRSVYGRYYPWLLKYGGAWTEGLTDKIFPSDNPNLRYAALETYLSNVLFEDSFEVLRPVYIQAIDDIKAKGGSKIPVRRYWADIPENIAKHAIVSYVFETENGPDPFYAYFFKKARGKTAGLAVSICGRSFISRDIPAGEKIPKMEILKRFWDWRLEESNSESELREFGWWAKSGKFEDQWMLERLLKTVEKTKGDINGEFIVIDTINSLSGDHPLLCAQILDKIFTTPSNQNRFVFMHMNEFRESATKILKGTNAESIKLIKGTIDHLLKLGYEDLRVLGDI